MFQIRHCLECGEVLEDDEMTLCGSCDNQTPSSPISESKPQQQYQEIRSLAEMNLLEAEIRRWYPNLIKDLDKIISLDHYQIAACWRFSKCPQIWLDSTWPLSRYFKARLFIHFGGFTPEISKHLSFNPTETPFD